MESCDQCSLVGRSITRGNRAMLSHVSLQGARNLRPARSEPSKLSMTELSLWELGFLCWCASLEAACGSLTLLVVSIANAPGFIKLSPPPEHRRSIPPSIFTVRALLGIIRNERARLRPGVRAGATRQQTVAQLLRYDALGSEIRPTEWEAWLELRFAPRLAFRCNCLSDFAQPRCEF